MKQCTGMMQANEAASTVSRVLADLERDAYGAYVGGSLTRPHGAAASIRFVQISGAHGRRTVPFIKPRPS